ncbi:MAG: hypothetical protein KH100_09820 [Dysgonomonas mossii]|uniref:hypothetical protein n=1 Tax=Dysgonomonas mossii TaxID=163665 RepID=UPI001D5FD1F3|nr:hypothetical protein [Dysgonomonas mossii]MBS5797602.1 hypothetical protein [Dysgonomonas mossii]MBS7111481.1 hypothetical protein [Dysgonomonas mossii]
MNISQFFSLNKSQAELDFVDINPTEDTPLFLDPFFLSKKQDNWSINATLTLRSFFQKLINLIREGYDDEARELFDYLHEPNSTCLGMSIGNPQGRGVGNQDTDKIYDSLLRSRAIQTGLIQDIEDNILFVDNFGKDKLSDMTTNIITKHLISYTQDQCRLHNIPLTPNTPSPYFWNTHNNEWHSEYTDMLIINRKKILLVPKGIVSYSKAYTPDKYYNYFVLEFLQNEHLRLQTALVQRRNNGVRFVTKKSLKEELPLSKEFLRRFTQDHPEILEDFKNQTDIESLTNQELDDLNIQQITQSLISRLQIIPSGTENASNFHNIIIGILELLFYPHLINPRKEREIHEGRKRIDITFDNAAKKGIFHILSEVHHIPCPYLYIECKNYSRDIANPELDQIAGRFSFQRGKVGFVVCRSIENLNLFMNRCKDTYRDDRGLIIPLVDEDLILLLQNYNESNQDFMEHFLSDRVRELIMG